MSRTSKALRRLSVPVLVGSVIMTGVSGLGFAGVANAIGTPGTLTFTIDNTDGVSGAYATTAANNPTPADTLQINAQYDQGTDPNSTAKGGFAQTLTFTLSGSAIFTNGPGAGSNTTSCVTTGGTGTSCTTPPQFFDPVSELVTVTASDANTIVTPNNDPTVAAVQHTAHIAGLHFSNCSQQGFNTNVTPATAPDNFCSVQAQKSVEQVQTLTYLQDGTPTAGVTVSLVFSGGGTAAFIASPGVVAAGSNAVCTTNAAGQCVIHYIDNTNENNQTITATTSNDGLYPASTAKEDVDFVPSATPGRIIDQNSDIVVYPTTQVGTDARPGDAIQKQFQLLSTCTTAAGDATCDTTNTPPGQATPLVNRQVTLTVDHGFFTPNCTADGKGSPTPSYDQCKFTPTPTAGSKVGELTSLGTSTTVTTDDNGYFYATIGIKRDAGFDDDGEVDVTITGTSPGGTGTLTANNAGNGTAGQNCTTSPGNGGCPYLTTWYTDNRPLNAGTLKLVGVDAANDISANPNNVPFGPNTPEERTFVAHLTDQFGNLTRNNTCSIALALTNNTANAQLTDYSICGSYLTEDNYSFDESTIYAANVGTARVTATYSDDHNTFATYTPAAGATPAIATFASTPMNITDVVNFNFYDQLAQPVITFTTTPSNTVPAGTAVTVSATVKDQFGKGIKNQHVTFLVTGPNQSSCNPKDNTSGGVGYTSTNSAGRAGFVFSCNVPGVATVSIVVTDASNNELARGVQNVTFTGGPPPPNTGDPGFTLNVHTIQIGQCAVLTVNGTPGHTITIFVKGYTATGFTALNSMQSGQHMRVCPGTNSQYKVSSDLGTSAAQTLLVKAIETLKVYRHGQSAHFAGHVVPGVVGRRVQVFFYVAGGHVEDGGVGTVQPGGNFGFDHAVNHPGKVVYFFAQTFADGINTAGRSILVPAQF